VREKEAKGERGRGEREKRERERETEREREKEHTLASACIHREPAIKRLPTMLGSPIISAFSKKTYRTGSLFQERPSILGRLFTVATPYIDVYRYIKK